jgi:hypothetical protein
MRVLEPIEEDEIGLSGECAGFGAFWTWSMQGRRVLIGGVTFSKMLDHLIIGLHCNRDS